MEYKIREDIYNALFNVWDIEDNAKFSNTDSTIKRTSWKLTKRNKKIKVSTKKIVRKNKFWSNYKTKKVLDLKDSGYTLSDIATIMKTTRGSISGVIFRNKI